MNCGEIIKKYLIDNGFDGLACTEVDCGCDIDNLFLCEEHPYNCVPAIKVTTKCEDCENGKQRECYCPDGKEKICYEGVV